MRRLSDIPIKAKLSLVMTATSAAALVLLTASLSVYDVITLRGDLAHFYETRALILADTCSAALAFDDKAAAEQTLSFLRNDPQITAVSVYRAGGGIFAAYRRETEPGAVPEDPGPERVEFSSGALTVVRSIRLQSKILGTLREEISLQQMYNRIRLFVGTAFIILLGSLGAAYLLALRFQRIVSGPILELAGVAARVSKDRDYSIRAVPRGKDELGRLIEGFNDMLAQIQERDAALLGAQSDLERRVRERTAQLEASNKELEAFSYSVSHDLRAPLRAVDGFGQILVEDHAATLDAEGRRILDTIRTNTRQMGQLIDDLLTFSRLGRQDLREVPIDMTGLARSVWEESVRQAAPALPVAVEFEDLPAAMGDPAMMRQVFVNLISNALKYTRGRTDPAVRIGSRREKSETIYFVEDNGVGFDMKYVEKLFKVFQRLHRQEEFEGTGIGLALVQRIIQRHGGRVWAEGRPDQGATFYFALPGGSLEVGKS